MISSQAGATSAELISALVDGETCGDNLDLALGVCRDDDGLPERWSTYHLIGDALRFPTAGVQVAGADFHQRFAQRFALEPAFVLESADVSQSLPEPIAPVLVSASRLSAANDYSFRWKVLAGLASFTAISAISWGLFSPENSGLAASATAPLGEQILIATPQGPMVRDVGVHEWMEAHRQLGSSPTQMPSGFLRSATFETPPGGAGR